MRALSRLLLIVMCKTIGIIFQLNMELLSNIFLNKIKHYIKLDSKIEYNENYTKK